MFVNVPPLHPPLTVVEAKNVFQAALTCAWVLHAATQTLLPALIVTADPEIENRLVQVNELLLPQPDCDPHEPTE